MYNPGINERGGEKQDGEQLGPHVGDRRTWTPDEITNAAAVTENVVYKGGFHLGGIHI